MKGLSIAYVKSVIEKAMSGRITTEQAAAKLGISRQYVNRLEKKYSEKGESAFVHGNRGRERKWKTSPETEARILELRETKYRGFNFVHFLEKLGEVEHIRISYAALHRWFGEGFPKATLHGAVDIYVTLSGKTVAVYDGKLCSLVEVEKRKAEPEKKRRGRPKWVPGPNHPWRKFVISSRKEGGNK